MLNYAANMLMPDHQRCLKSGRPQNWLRLSQSTLRTSSFGHCLVRCGAVGDGPVKHA